MPSLPLLSTTLILGLLSMHLTQACVTRSNLNQVRNETTSEVLKTSRNSRAWINNAIAVFQEATQNQSRSEQILLEGIHKPSIQVAAGKISELLNAGAVKSSDLVSFGEALSEFRSEGKILATFLSENEVKGHTTRGMVESEGTLSEKKKVWSRRVSGCSEELRKSSSMCALVEAVNSTTTLDEFHQAIQLLTNIPTIFFNEAAVDQVQNTLQSGAYPYSQSGTLSSLFRVCNNHEGAQRHLRVCSKQNPLRAHGVLESFVKPYQELLKQAQNLLDAPKYRPGNHYDYFFNHTCLIGLNKWVSGETKMLSSQSAAQQYLESASFCSASKTYKKAWPLSGGSSILKKPVNVVGRSTVRGNWKVGVALPSFAPMGLEEFNDLSPYPIFILGINDTAEQADLSMSPPQEFLTHDLLHTGGARVAAKGIRGHSHYDYDTLNFKMGPKLKELSEARVRFYNAVWEKLGQKLNRAELNFAKEVWFHLNHEHNYVGPKFLLNRARLLSKNGRNGYWGNFLLYLIEDIQETIANDTFLKRFPMIVDTKSENVDVQKLSNTLDHLSSAIQSSM